MKQLVVEYTKPKCKCYIDVYKIVVHIPLNANISTYIAAMASVKENNQKHVKVNFLAEKCMANITGTIWSKGQEDQI